MVRAGVVDRAARSLGQDRAAALCSRESKGIHDVDWLPTANLVVRTSFFKRIGGFNEALETCEDVDLGYRLRLHGVVIYDPQMTVYHLREPRSFGGFIKKEVWHAKSNISGLLSHSLRLSEIPSLVSPLLFGAGILSGSIGIVFSNEILTGGFSVSLMIPIVYTIKGYRRTKNIPLVFLIYCAYFTARSYAAMHEIWKLLLDSRKTPTV